MSARWACAHGSDRVQANRKRRTDLRGLCEAVEELEASEASEEDEEAVDTEEEPGEDGEFEAEADAEPGLEEPAEDVPAVDEAVTGGTETCGDVEPDEADR